MDGLPQRPQCSVRVPALVLGVVCLIALARPVAAQTGFLANGDFEAGVTGCSAVGDVDLLVDGSTGVVDGAAALHVTAGTGGVYQVRSQYWLGAPVTLGAAYGLEAWILDDDPRVAVSLGLDFLDGAGTRLTTDSRAAPSADAPAFQRLSVQRAARPGSVYARAVLEGNFDGAGATFAVDGVVLAQVGAVPTVEPTVQPPPPAPVVTTPVAAPTPRAGSSAPMSGRPLPDCMPRSSRRRKRPRT